MKDKTNKIAVSAFVDKDVKRKFNEWCEAKGLRVLYVTDKIVEQAMRQLYENDLVNLVLEGKNE